MSFDQEAQKQLEVNYLKLLIDLLKTNKITVKIAKQATHEFLNIKDISSDQEIKQKMKLFTEKYKEFSPLYVKIVADNPDEDTKELLQKMQKLMNDRKVDEVITLAT